jgi:class 3 adenylate cyclase
MRQGGTMGGVDRFEPLADVGVGDDVVAAMRALVRDAPDGQLVHIDPLDFADRHGLAAQATIDAFLHATRLGLFDLSWNVVCPDCGGILSASITLGQIRHSELGCALCDRTYECDLDDRIAVTFTVNPRVRTIRAHRPDQQTPIEYLREHYLGPTLALPHGADFQAIVDRWCLWQGTVPAGAAATAEVMLPAGWVIVCEYRMHGATIVEVAGEAATAPQPVTVTLTHAGASPRRTGLRPGPARITIENRSDGVGLVTLAHANDALHDMMARRKPYLTGKQVVTSQTFRNLFRSDVLAMDQGLKLRNLTVLFTDVRGSTELYDRIGDLAAYDLVRRHFGVLGEVVRDRGGSIVKTIGDAVMASFPSPAAGMAAALDMRAEMATFNRRGGADEIVLKIGMHAGPCLAVWSNDRLDFFGQTVNIAARVQSIARAGSIVATARVALDDQVRRLLDDARATPTARQATLRGIRDEVTVFEVPPG